jgi:hypothetical protein
MIGCNHELSPVPILPIKVQVCHRQRIIQWVEIPLEKWFMPDIGFRIEVGSNSTACQTGATTTMVGKQAIRHDTIQAVSIHQNGAFPTGIDPLEHLLR